MTNKELIEYLEQFPLEAEVKVYDFGEVLTSISKTEIDGYIYYDSKYNEIQI